MSDFPEIPGDWPALLLGLVALALVAMVCSRAYWNSRLRRWAESQKLELVSVRGAKSWEGPRAGRRSENQSLFHVAIKDPHGRERRCWIMFGSVWGFTLGEPISEVIWDDV